MPLWNLLKWGCYNNWSHHGSTTGRWGSRRRRSANQSFSGQRGAIRVMERMGVSDSSHHPYYQRKGWKRVQVQVAPRMTECILEDLLGIRDMGTVQGEIRIVTRRKQVDRWRAPTTKQVSHHPRVERQLGPYNLIPTAEEICQNIGLPWRRWDLTIHQEKSFLTSHYKGTGREGGSDSGDQFVFKCHCRECIRRRLRGTNLSSEAR